MRDLRLRIEREVNIPRRQQGLQYRGQRMPGRARLIDYDLRMADTVYVSVTQAGAADGGGASDGSEAPTEASGENGVAVAGSARSRTAAAAASA